MGWRRDRLARLGVRGPPGRDAIAADVGSLLARLGCRDRVLQAVVYAYEHGVVTPGEDPTGPAADGEEEGRR